MMPRGLDLSIQGTGLLKAKTEAEEQADRELLNQIVWSEHQGAIAKACKTNHYVIAVRETGAPSIMRIAQGAKAKPHLILQKSVKPDSLKKLPGGASAITPELLEVMEGFVGHWQYAEGDTKRLKPMALLGLVAAPPGESPDREVNSFFVVEDSGPDRGVSYVPVGVVRAYAATSPHWARHLYTGDYDLHEAHRPGLASGTQILEGTQQKAELLNTLNAEIAAVDPLRRGRASLHAEEDRRAQLHMDRAGSHYAMFQHGDQATYGMSLRLEFQEGGGEVIAAVANEDPKPLAWCDFHGVWRVSRNPGQHAQMRKMLGVQAWHGEVAMGKPTAPMPKIPGRF